MKLNPKKVNKGLLCVLAVVLTRICSGVGLPRDWVYVVAPEAHKTVGVAGVYGGLRGLRGVVGVWGFRAW